MTEAEVVEVEQSAQGELSDHSELTTQELVAQRKELDARIAAAKKAEGAAALKQIVGLMQTYDIASDAVTKAAAKASKSAAKAKSKAKDTGSVDGRAKVAPKFQDPVTGATWTGRGKCPKWFDAETAIKL